MTKKNTQKHYLIWNMYNLALIMCGEAEQQIQLNV